MLIAAAGGQTKILKYLLGSGASVDYVDDNGMTALQYASLSGFKDCVQLLLDANAEVNAVSEVVGTPLCIAVGKERFRIVELLLDQRANIEAPGGEFGSALHIACSSGEGICNSLLQRNPRVYMHRKVDLDRLEKYFAQPLSAAFDEPLPVAASEPAKSKSRLVVKSINCAPAGLVLEGAIRTV